jgi:ABC-type antimicrobial peptide transport system permease subunit
LSARVLSGLLFGVSANDPATFVLVALLLGAAASIASYVPAHRATQIAPITALRQD